ncbi:hypothetical protein [Halopseudomonas salegens]|uniref:Uncharacterized protein n=1 Tax=Halopseudomonas salegens TaxID=1434072 RepID=A0A1H2E5Q0_9GAMM|nr:hypothetical protein [Halopseudomonas salegens]SDT90447.1 hypothetical protein SAMN05216210_0364 [Halopseudomonas salegens]
MSRLYAYNMPKGRSLPSLVMLAVSALTLSGCLSGSSGSSSSDELAPAMPELDAERVRPLVFVHGLAGSGSQYQTQALRFASNGYPEDLVHAFEYSTASLPEVIAAASGSQAAPLDAFIDNLLATHDQEQVYLACHSLGVTVCSNYLGNPDHAAKVAGFVGIDGATNETCPGDVPCMGVYVNEAAELGENNLYLPDETHVQVATSEASFAGQFEFFTGVEPARTQILPVDGDISVSGRAVLFPANSGAAGTTLNVWSIDPATGDRQGSDPLATADIDATGEWGPFNLQAGDHYEFQLLRPGRAEHHFYRQPFLRNANLVRFNTSPAGSDIETNTHTGSDHAALVISRDMEWWGDRGEDTDRLEIATTSALWPDEEPFDVLTNIDVNNVIGIHVHDAESHPAITSGELLPYFPDQPFQSGVDVNMPATSPPDGVITVTSYPRGDSSRPQVFNVPNRASASHRVSLIFNDFVQD